MRKLLAPISYSCPIDSAAANSENMGGGSIKLCHVGMGVGMNINYQPPALIVCITLVDQKSLKAIGLELFSL